jgi:hypothetical protein
MATISKPSAVLPLASETDQRTPPASGPSTRAAETVDWARPLARLTTSGGLSTCDGERG